MARSRIVLPINRMAAKSHSGIFVKRSSDWHLHRSEQFPHRDDYYIFSFVVAGQISAMVDFKKIGLTGCQGIIVAPWQVHAPVVGPALPEAWLLFVAAEHISDSVRQIIERYILLSQPIGFTPRQIDDLKALFRMLYENAYGDVCLSAIATADVEIFCGSISMSENGYNNSSRYTSLVVRMKRLIDSHIAECRRPADYASMLNVSRVYLNEAVKAVTGVSAGEFIRSHAVLSAKRMLVHTDLDINQIAEGLGYDDTSYFSRMFKKETGLTPSEFRENLV
jgi:AraC family transcriptional activator of pobA